MRQPTMLRRLPWLAATAALTLLCVPRDQARADEKSDLIYKIEGRLRDAASALAYLPSESSESPIDRARDYVREAHGYADQLKQVAGDDSDARRIAENFRDVEDDWNDAANQLRQLKGGQRRAEPAATACTTRDEELKRKANDFGRANDPDGLAELPRLAATAQDTTRRELDELRSHDGRMDDYADDADDFRGDGPWRDLASATASAAQQTYAVWRKSWEVSRTGGTDPDRVGQTDPPIAADELAAIGDVGVTGAGRRIGSAGCAITRHLAGRRAACGCARVADCGTSRRPRSRRVRRGAGGPWRRWRAAGHRRAPAARRPHGSRSGSWRRVGTAGG